MDFSDQGILQWFAQYAFEPGLVYSAIVILMIMSSFGLPIPEEVTLLSAGIVCYMGTRPDLYPPPFADAPTVDTMVTCVICFFAVFLSDFLVFTLGRNFGSKILGTRLMKRYEKNLGKVERWTRKYGAWAAGVFRFTPGLRFPGHFSCGMLGLSPLKFIAVDGFAALISVPTQVLLIATFGETILENIKQTKVVLFSALGIGLLVYLILKYRQRQESTA